MPDQLGARDGRGSGERRSQGPIGARPAGGAGRRDGGMGLGLMVQNCQEGGGLQACWYKTSVGREGESGGDVDMSERKDGRWKIQDDYCYILTVDSSSDEELDYVSSLSYTVIDSDSDNEYLCERKRAKIAEIHSKDEILEVSDTHEQPPQGCPVLITDDEDDHNDLEGPVLIEDDSCDEDQTPSNEKKKNECAVYRHNSSHVVDNQDLGEDVCQPPSDDPKAELEISAGKLSRDEEPVCLVAKPRKRKYKTKNIPVTPVVKRPKKHEPLKEKPRAAEFEKCEPGHSECKIPGCFLRGIENSKQYSGKNFKQNKDELVQKIYDLCNSSVFDKKLPEKIDITWNKKMLRTAGLCAAGEIQHLKGERFAKIQLSQKVCDSADRLRDTLIHEICHVASWLLDGKRDFHGDTWKNYARKLNMVHPELPKVTRCHDYKINYKIYYECTNCKFRVGRYSKSLDTKRFICARCKGSLVILPLTRKDGTPIKPHVRPFAKYVQENYRIVRKEMAGIGHGDVMRKLSKDFNAKKQSQVR
ncbi:germ cell nuclear acidic protein [Mesoplodon densirostris]|uniref:germ cell nuclear acidic protein n=1 Tax=Mesoplodon densirostris TaxID=48708 RepID=UPI0028DD067D|nr:germ cell nuclear acidic protein [Mesoplodon densirostris]